MCGSNGLGQLISENILQQTANGPACSTLCSALCTNLTSFKPVDLDANVTFINRSVDDIACGGVKSANEFTGLFDVVLGDDIHP